MININLLLCKKYYVMAGIYTLWIGYVSGQLILLNAWGDMFIVDMDMGMGMSMHELWYSELCDIYFYTICCRYQVVCWCNVLLHSLWNVSIATCIVELYLKLVLYGCPLPEVEGMCSANHWIS